ncbi:MAG: NAD-binding protein [Chloroflexi bacterium]|nr:NAD-binding protein [Chloroflexota bacterium]
MYIIVVGAGKVGYHLAKALLKSEHEVFIVERSARKCEDIKEELGSLVVVGDGCEEGVLKEAGTSRADVFIAVTGNDEDNLVACQMAKHRFGVPRTIALINNPNNEALFQELGVDVCVSSTEIILSHIEEELPSHPLVHVMTIKGSNREVVGIRIPPDSAVVGKTLRDVPVPSETVISFIVRKDGTLLVPTDDSALSPEDEVVAITTGEGEESLRDALTGVE